MNRLEDLESEVAALDKASGQLLIQRRKLHARIKSILKTIMRKEKAVADAHGESIDREFTAAADNALNLEVWLTEYRQITAALIDEHRGSLAEAEALHEAVQQGQERAAESAAARDQAQAQLDALEHARRDLAERLDAQRDENEILFQRFSESDERLSQLEAALGEARAAATAAGAHATRPAAAPSDLVERLAQAEAKYEALELLREKERRSHTLELASLAKQMAELRDRSEAVSRSPVTATASPSRAATSRERSRFFDDEEIATERPQPAAPTAPAAPHVRAALSPLIPTGESAPRSGAKPAAHRPTEVVILDDERRGPETAERLTAAGYPVTAFMPDPELIGQLPGRSIACLALNLADPRVWTAVRTMRSDPQFPPMPLVGYALAPPAAKGFWFGAVDFYILPPVKDTLHAVLQRVAGRLKQVVMLGADEELTGTVSRMLTRAGVNTAAAKDRGEALEILRSVYPHAFLIYPSSSPVDVFRAIPAIRELSLFRRTPLVFLLDETPPPHEEALFSNTARQIMRVGSLRPEDLPDTLAHAFGAYVRPKK